MQDRENSKDKLKNWLLKSEKKTISLLRKIIELPISKTKTTNSKIQWENFRNNYNSYRTTSVRSNDHFTKGWFINLEMEDSCLISWRFSAANEREDQSVVRRSRVLQISSTEQRRSSWRCFLLPRNHQKQLPRTGIPLFWNVHRKLTNGFSWRKDHRKLQKRAWVMPIPQWVVVRMNSGFQLNPYYEYLWKNVNIVIFKCLLWRASTCLSFTSKKMITRVSKPQLPKNLAPLRQISSVNVWSSLNICLEKVLNLSNNSWIWWSNNIITKPSNTNT